MPLMKRAYLAGAIFREIDPMSWRRRAAKLMPEGWEAVNPLDMQKAWELTPDELVKRDYMLIQESQAIVAYVNKPSWGTAMELAYAKRINIPVIGWTPRPLIRRLLNPWLVAHCHKICGSLSEACLELRNVNDY